MERGHLPLAVVGAGCNGRAGESRGKRGGRTHRRAGASKVESRGWTPHILERQGCFRNREPVKGTDRDMANEFGRGSVYNARAQASEQIDQGLRSYMLRIYNYMTTGIVLTGAVSSLVANSAERGCGEK